MQLHRLSRHHGGCEPPRLGILIHDPRHHLGVGVYIRSGHVRVGADHLVQAIHILARNGLQFPHGKLPGVAGDAALAPTEWDVDHRRFPGHQGCEGLHLFRVYRGVVAQPAFHGAARVVVLHPVSDEGADLSRVRFDGDFHLDFPRGRPEHGLGTVVVLHQMGCTFKVLPCDFQ